MLLTILPIFIESKSINLIDVIFFQTYCWNFFFFFPSFFLCFFCLLAETNRVPFDLPEAESELVSGYNVEYSAVGFVFFFLAEYSNIILASSLLTILFFGNFFFIIFIFLCFFFFSK